MINIHEWFKLFIMVYLFVVGILLLLSLLLGGQVECIHCHHYNQYTFLKPRKCKFCGEKIG